MSLWWLLALLVPICTAFGWTIGNLQGRASLALDVLELRNELEAISTRLAQAHADIDRLRAPAIDHAASVSVLRDATDDYAS